MALTEEKRRKNNERNLKYYYAHREELLERCKFSNLSEEAKTKRKAARKKYYEANKELIKERSKEYKKEYSKKYYQLNKDKLKAPDKFLYYKRTYGLNKEGYDALLSEQSHKCGACTQEFTEDNVPHVDHCHTTGKVRGLLCHKCNAGIGLLGDTQEGVLKALVYLGWKNAY